MGTHSTCLSSNPVQRCVGQKGSVVHDKSKQYEIFKICRVGSLRIRDPVENNLMLRPDSVSRIQSTAFVYVPNSSMYRIRLCTGFIYEPDSSLCL